MLKQLWKQVIFSHYEFLVQLVFAPHFKQRHIPRYNYIKRQQQKNPRGIEKINDPLTRLTCWIKELRNPFASDRWQTFWHESQMPHRAGLILGQIPTKRSLCTSQFQNRPSPPPRAIPGHLTRVKLRTVGNLTQNEARLVGHLTFVSKRLSAVGSRRISQFFDSAGEPRSRVIALVDSTWVFLLFLLFYHGICLCLKCGAKTSWTKNS